MAKTDNSKLEEKLIIRREVIDKIGKLNNYNGLDAKIDWASFIREAVGICRHHNLPFYVKHDLAAFNQGTPLNPEERDQDYLNI